MTAEVLRRSNHYVARLYLKRWACSDKKIWTYRTLVSHDNVPLWKQRSTRGVAYHSHLYTRLVAGQETDEIEKWLDREFEAPAAEALEKATSGGRLTPRDWEQLVRFLASQDVRTPARLAEFLQRWSKDAQELLDEVIREGVAKAEAAYQAGESLPSIETSPRSESLPFRIKKKIKPGAEYGEVRGEMVVGRGLWLWSLRHLLTSTAGVLHKHRWTILAPPNGLTWFTSDNPVLRLNFNSPKEYDLNGGWDNKGTDIFLPLSPHHLLYTQVGYRPPPRGEVMPLSQAKLARKYLAENADRMIFASGPDDEVPQLRPRVVNDNQVKHERAQWAEWHQDQTKAEQELMGDG